MKPAALLLQVLATAALILAAVFVFSKSGVQVADNAERVTVTASTLTEIKVGDVVVSLDGKTVWSARQLTERLIWSLDPEKTVTVGLANRQVQVGMKDLLPQKEVRLKFLPPIVAHVPGVYFFSAIGTILSLATFFVLSKAWLKDALPAPFISKVKSWAVTTLLLTMLQAMIFVSVTWQKVRAGKNESRPLPTTHLLEKRA